MTDSRDPSPLEHERHEHHEHHEHHAHHEHHEHKAHLDPSERTKARQRESISARVTHEVIRREGLKELDRRVSALAWSGLAGGLAIGLSVLARAALHAELPETTWRPLVSALGYSVGFLAVALGSQHLYTENTLTPIVPLLARRTTHILKKVLLLWGVVLLANLIGAAVFGWAAARTAIVPPAVQHAIHTLALQSISPGALEIFARAIVAGWIIALMVWMLPGAEPSKVLVIIIMTWLVGAASLSHVIVGSVEVFYLVSTHDLSLGAGLSSYILPALLGNTLGGVAIVAALNHAQVESE